MENLIMKSFLDYPQYIEDFLEDISLKSFTPFNQKLMTRIWSGSAGIYKSELKPFKNGACPFIIGTNC